MADEILNDDMSTVAAADDAAPEGQYQFRVSSADVREDATTGNKRVLLQCNIQTEGPAFGRSVMLNLDLGDPRGRSNLKSVYKAVGYNPGPEGHQPSKVLDGEFKATVKHHIKDGVTYANISPWTIKPIFG